MEEKAVFYSLLLINISRFLVEIMYLDLKDQYMMQEFGNRQKVPHIRLCCHSWSISSARTSGTLSKGESVFPRFAGSLLWCLMVFCACAFTEDKEETVAKMYISELKNIRLR